MRVAVVIPCYNVARFIEESLRSVFDQEHKEIELICVDNNSTDSTWEVLQSLCEIHASLKIEKELKPGAPAARNRGLELSSADWIQFLDADDILLPNKISSQLQAIEGISEAAIIVGDYERLDLSTNERQEISANRNEWHGLINNRLGITSANLFHRNALEEVGGFDETLKSSQEYDLMFRIMQNHSVVFSEGVHTVIRSRSEGSISKSDIKGNQHRYLQLTGRIAQYMRIQRPQDFNALGEKWFQDMFIRIMINTQDGHNDSGAIFEQIMPKDFKPQPRPFVSKWFRIVMNVFGFEVADRLQRIRR